MGVIRKQAIGNVFITYAGAVLGAINYLFLFPRMLSPEQFGLFQFCLAQAMFFSLVASLGTTNTLVRFFPFYKTNDNQNGGIIEWIIYISFIGFLLFLISYILGRPLFEILFRKKSSLIIDYYWLLLPLTFASLVLNFLESIFTIVYKTLITNFFREVALRLFTMLSVFAYYYHLINFTQFLYIFVAINLILSAILLICFVQQTKIRFRILKFKIPENSSALVEYGLYAFFSGIPLLILQNLDKQFLSVMVGLPILGVFATYSNIGIFISIPAKALGRITKPVIADAWKNNDVAQIQRLYTRTSILQMGSGLLLYIGILINKDNLMVMLQHKKIYEDNFLIFVFMGFAFLIDMTAGINYMIISTSNRFRADAIFNVLLMIVAALANYLLIPYYGGIGAAAASTLAYLLVNFAKWLYILIHFNMQPFTLAHVGILGIGFIALLAGFYLPRTGGLIVDIFARSSLTGLLYLIAIYVFKISKDINIQINLFFGKLINVFSKTKG